MFAELRQYLDRYVHLTDEDFNFFSQLVDVRTFDRRVRLVEIGQVEEYLSFIVHGLIRKYFFRGNHEVITHLVKEGGIIASSVSFFSGTPSNYITETIEPTTVVSINRENLEILFAADEKWERMGRLIMADFLLEKEYWLLDNVSSSSREKFMRFISEKPDLLNRVPQKYLASYLNVKPETFSRLKQALNQRKSNPELY